MNFIHVWRNDPNGPSGFRQINNVSRNVISYFYVLILKNDRFALARSEHENVVFNKMIKKKK